MDLRPAKLFKCCCLCSALIWLGNVTGIRAQDLSSPRFFKLNFQSLSAPGRLISSEGDRARAEDKESNYFLEAELRYPISLKGKTKIIGEIGYDREVVFGLYTYNIANAEDFTFYNISHSLLGIHDIDEKWRYFARLKIQSGAEQLIPIHRQSFNGNFSHFLEKREENHTIGFGFQISHNQTLTILPVFRYEKAFANGWGIDISLPQQILVTKKYSRSNQFYAGLKGARSSYWFRDELEDISTDLYYRRITMNMVVGVEKQLTSFLGLMLEAGATRPLRSAVYEYDNGWDKLHDFNEAIAPYVNFGIFMSIDRSDL